MRINNKGTWALVLPNGKVLERFRTSQSARSAIPMWKYRTMEKVIRLVQLKDTAQQVNKKMREKQNG